MIRDLHFVLELILGHLDTKVIRFIKDYYQMTDDSFHDDDDDDIVGNVVFDAIIIIIISIFFIMIIIIFTILIAIIRIIIMIKTIISRHWEWWSESRQLGWQLCSPAKLLTEQR